MTENAPDKWLDTPEPQPRLGWYKDMHTGRIHLSKTKRSTRKRKFGSTSARPQKVYWQREDDRTYYEATYGWSSCWFCRECSCCCKCHGPAAASRASGLDADADSDAETQTEQEEQQQQEAAVVTQMQST